MTARSDRPPRSPSSSASMNAIADSQRSSRWRESARAMTASAWCGKSFVRCFDESEGASFWIFAIISAVGCSASKGTSPVSISKATVASE